MRIEINFVSNNELIKPTSHYSISIETDDPDELSKHTMDKLVVIKERLDELCMD